MSDALPIALVTGGSRGIGRAISERLARDGYRVVVNYAANEQAATETVQAIEQAGGQAMAHQADVADRGAVDAMFGTVEETWGSVVVLVNNAGITRDGLLMRMGDDDWDDVISTNLTSAFACTKRALKGMLRAKWGRIISISSVSGLAGNAGQANYAASKAGLVGFMKSVAKEVGSRSITANTVAPGFIATDMTAALGDAAGEAVVGSISAGRLGTPEEIAGAVSYLASPDAAYVTGQVLVVDGGLAL